MKYYLPAFEDIDNLKEDFAEEFLAARRVSAMFSRGDESMGSFYAQNSYDAAWDDDEMRYW